MTEYHTIFSELQFHFAEFAKPEHSNSTNLIRRLGNGG